MEDDANATLRAGNNIRINRGTTIRGGTDGSVTFETGAINCNVRLAYGDFISGPCNAQVSFKKESTNNALKKEGANANNITIYPNPTDNTLSIDREESNGKTLHYQLLNIHGQQVKTGTINQQSATLSLTELSSGIYPFRQ